MEQVVRINCGAVNCYLLKGDNGSILIDTGRKSDFAKIIRAVSGEPLKLIVLTHGHIDHTGTAAKIAEKLKVPIAMSRNDYALLDNPKRRKLQAHKLSGKLLAAIANVSMKKGTGSPLKIDLWLRNGQTLSELGINAKMVALPGHTAGSVGVLTDSGDFIVGDAVFQFYPQNRSAAL